MEEQQNNNPKSWAEVYRAIAERQIDSSNKLASEMLEDSDKKDKRKTKIIAYLIGVICVLIIGLVGSNIYWVYQWSSYDYYSQDGDGTNYLNSDVEGDVVNGPKVSEKEE